MSARTPWHEQTHVVDSLVLSFKMIYICCFIMLLFLFSALEDKMSVALDQIELLQAQLQASEERGHQSEIRGIYLSVVFPLLLLQFVVISTPTITSLPRLNNAQYILREHIAFFCIIYFEWAGSISR